MSNLVRLSLQGRIGVITIDNPPVNALSTGVRKGMLDLFEQAARDDSMKAVVLICAGRTFIAGADISEFGKPFQNPWLPEVLDRIENCPKPVLAAMHGSILGGGLEVAMTCHYRAALPSARFGQPEVMLGLLPGAGGTQRLPRLIGAEKALEMITGGKPIGSLEAKERGLIDEVIEGNLLEGALKFAETLISRGAPLKKARDRTVQCEGGDPTKLFQQARQALSKSRRGLIAPQRCVDAVEAACTIPFEEGIAKERELFQELVQSDQSAGQRHIFFAERAASKIVDKPADVKPNRVNQGAVIGAGTMGGGIAMNFANAGIPTTLLDVSQEALDKGMAVVRGNYERSMKKGRLSASDLEKRMALIKPTLEFDDLKEVDFVIEAVFEEMDIKKDIFRKLDRVCRKDTILATNTSTLDVDEIAASVSRPERVVGTHFFSPANVMKLLEVVRAAKTDFPTLATTLAVAKAMRKVPVVVGVCDGFVGNRMLHPYLSEAGFLLEEGALPQQVDRALYAWGLAMGPFAMGDMAGLDVGWRIRKRRGRPEGKRYSAIADKICERGRFGQKTGKGFYLYDAGSRIPKPDPEIEELIVNESRALGIKRREISDEEIVERCIYALVNQGAQILDEGIAQRAGDIDVIYVYGYGFPAHRGGPMFYADTVGLRKVHERIGQFNERAVAEAPKEDRWKPAPLLKKLAEEGGTFD